jgi:arylsulfatase A-like enzyme
MSVVLITIDTLRADRLGVYGFEGETSPTIDAFAEEGVVFENAFVPRGQTWPALASLMTATYPITHGVRSNGDLLEGGPIQLAETLKKEGFTTAAFITNAKEQTWRGFDVLEKGEDDEIHRKATAWLRANSQSRVFVWIHLLAPHWTYTPPPPYDTMFNPGYAGGIDGTNEGGMRVIREQGTLTPADVEQYKALYSGEVRHSDDLVMGLLDTLSETGMDKRSLVVFSSDHGEELADHNDYWDHTSSVYDTVYRVPLVFRLPTGQPAQGRVDTPVEIMDIAPTILSYLEIEAPENADGANLAPLWQGEALDLGPVFGEWEDRIQTVRTSKYKYISNPGNYSLPSIRWGEKVRFSVATEELYDIQADPLEQHNLAGELPEMVAELQATLDDWREAHGWVLNTGPDVDREMGEKIIEELRALGYVE